MPLTGTTWFESQDAPARRLGAPRLHVGQGTIEARPIPLFEDSQNLLAWSGEQSRPNPRRPVREAYSLELLQALPIPQDQQAAATYEIVPQRPRAPKRPVYHTEIHWGCPVFGPFVILDASNEAKWTPRRSPALAPRGQYDTVVFSALDLLRENSGWLPSQSVPGRRPLAAPSRQTVDCPPAYFVDVALWIASAQTVSVPARPARHSPLGAANSQAPIVLLNEAMQIAWEAVGRGAMPRAMANARRMPADDLSLPWSASFQLQFVSAWAILDRPMRRGPARPLPAPGNVSHVDMPDPGPYAKVLFTVQAPTRRAPRTQSADCVVAAPPIYASATIIVMGPYRVVSADVWAPGAQEYAVFVGQLAQISFTFSF